ncbi:hypothetical protein MGSAQ_000741 [marine sediment metagenome]|uniref:Uncharacterized protein n=1 Tax=marine sediment metagenome TaxID=412755 RepID=A0A1B6NWJ7_9ZZZZ
MSPASDGGRQAICEDKHIAEAFGCMGTRLPSGNDSTTAVETLITAGFSQISQALPDSLGA